MASLHQNPDDLMCRPIAFSRYDSDGTVEKTFWIRGDWTLVDTKKIGELVVREGPVGPLIKILMEPE